MCVFLFLLSFFASLTRDLSLLIHPGENFMNQSTAHLLSCTAGRPGVGGSSQAGIKNGRKSVKREAKKIENTSEGARSTHQSNLVVCVCVRLCVSAKTKPCRDEE